MNDRRRLLQALQVVRMAEQYSPSHQLDGGSIESHYQARVAFCIRYFQVRAGEGTDMEIAHPSSYGACTDSPFLSMEDGSPKAVI